MKIDLHDSDLYNFIKQLGFDEFFHGQLKVEGSDPILYSRHKLGKAISIVLALQNIAAASFWKYRNNEDTDISFKMEEVIHFLHPTHYVWQNGYKVEVGAEKVPLNGMYPCRDGKWIYLIAGPPYLKLLNAYLDFFDCGHNRKSIAREVVKWDGFELEEALSNAGLPASIARTKVEWRNHPQGKVLFNQPVIQIKKLSEGNPVELKANQYPLSEIRVLDFSHVLAGPRTAKSLAEYGADVLHIRSPYELDPLASNLSVNHGKRSAYLDLNKDEDLMTMYDLMVDADVFTYSWRPGVAERFQLNVDQAIKKSKKGLIYVSVNTYGYGGPWDNRPGFDMNGQMVSGFAIAEGSIDKPKISPLFYLNDLLTAYLAASGVMSALLLRAKEGGSYHVSVSLVRTSMWVGSLGITEDVLLNKLNLPSTDIYAAKLTTCQSDFGKFTFLDNPIKFSNFPKIPIKPPVFFGKDEAKW